MEWSLTTFLAIWGALLGTISLLWNLWRWRRELPQLAVKVEARESYIEEDAGCIVFEIRNRGGRPTTVEEIVLINYEDSFWGKLGFFGQCENVWVKYPETVKLPVVLKTGEVWKAHVPYPDEDHRLLDLDKADLILRRRLFYKITCAHEDRPIRGRVRREVLSPQI